MSIKVGIPRGMFYFDYYFLWKNFFNNLGVDVITSPKTNKDILNKGVELCVDEACLPIKIYHGHVDYLKDKVDYIFIPKMTSIHKKEYCCPKHIGLPDMIKNNIRNLPPLIDTEINLKKSHKNIKSSVFHIGKHFKKNSKTIAEAFQKAYRQYQEYIEMTTSKIIPIDINTKYKELSYITNVKKENYGRRIMVLGHSYNIYDYYINMDLISKLNKRRFDVVTAEMVKENRSREYAARLPKRMFWTHGQRIVGSAFALIEEKSISGIVYVSAFGCGLDSVLIDLIERKAKENRIPFTLLTLDEQTGEAGINTRVEAFIDMLEWRNRDEIDLSTHG
ncbi:MAG: hypothetical protein GX080_07780 [Tissierellia bacterium]|nr:hypothetical protein [Tissierellia bacterium]